MSKKPGTVHAKQVRGRMRIIGMGQTPSGQSFIKGLEELAAEELSNSKFKAEARLAVAKMFAESLATE